MVRFKKWMRIIGLAVVLLLAGCQGYIYVRERQSVIPDNLNMSSASMEGIDMTGMTMMDIPNTPGAAVTPLTSLTAPQTDAPVKTFTLTAQMATLDFGDGKPV